MKEYFKLAGLLFLAFIGVGCVVLAVSGGAWLAHWLWTNVHPVAGAVVGLAELSLGFAAVAHGGDDRGWA